MIRLAKIIICLVFVNISLFSQNIVNDTSNIAFTQQAKTVFTNKNFQWKYNRELAKLRRVYPMALQAAIIIAAHDEEIAKLDKNRKINKLNKQKLDELKEKFSYSIRDLYVSEGDLLIQLIHRETGLTVAEIMEMYSGKLNKSYYSAVAKLVEHDLNDTYDPKGDNWITEIVLEDIEMGLVPFDYDFHAIDRETYKEGMREYRDAKKATKLRVKAQKKAQKEADALAKKIARETKKANKNRK